jgi:hypothetical protein
MEVTQILNLLLQVGLEKEAEVKQEFDPVNLFSYPLIQQVLSSQ